MTLVLGAGISGISASYHLSRSGIKNIIFEKDSDWGGLCGNFEIYGFRFDKAIHLSFTDTQYVKDLFAKSCDVITHTPLSYNYYKGMWLKHPAQNNLHPLSVEEKVAIISDFAEIKEERVISNYEEWIIAQYGRYFGENFTIPYTRKYWTLEPKELSTTWIGNRMYKPNIKELLRGAFERDTPNTYYAKEMRYPREGGYKSFLGFMRKDCDIRLNKNVIEIDPKEKIVYFEDSTNKKYEGLISSIPLPEYANIIQNLPCEVMKACRNLKVTSIALVSIGLKSLNIPKHLWFYIYDENIFASRCFSPSIKSPDNAPEGCSSLQFEIYFSKDKPLTLSHTELVDHVISKSGQMQIFAKDDVIVKDCRVLEYGNVIFYHGMEKDRKTVLDYLKKIEIETIGRFGKWEYLWSDQSLLTFRGLDDFNMHTDL